MTRLQFGQRDVRWPLQSSSTNRRWRRPLQQRQHRLADELALHQLRGDAREFADAAAPLDHRLELLAGSGAMRP